MPEDWELLKSFLPGNWRELARETGALKGLRKDKSEENLLRVLLIHLGCGHSLRETVVRAKKAGLAELSDVALLKRLKKSRDWLRAMCLELFRDEGVTGTEGFEFRVMDATTVREPGKSGSLWRIHYSVRLPSLACDFFKVTGTEGAGSGESLTQFPIRAGDHVLADRGYSRAPGIVHVASSGGDVTVRVNTQALALWTRGGERLRLLETVSSLRRIGKAGSWPARGGGSGWRDGDGPDLCGAQEPGGDSGGAGKNPPRRQSEGDRDQAPDAGVRQVHHRVHHLPRRQVLRRGGVGVLSAALAGGTRLQAVQILGPTGPPAQIRRRQRPSLALRQAALGAACRKS